MGPSWLRPSLDLLCEPWLWHWVRCQSRCLRLPLSGSQLWLVMLLQRARIWVLVSLAALFCGGASLPLHEAWRVEMAQVSPLGPVNYV